ncbi:hypothetical protein [Sphingomonas koreensis]|jgi:hypothetical protein|uniref:hypothetical protein n=1 Tax=Sphingomonas koreensis TaxID=93064 RepID=UPI000F7F36BF|nr:hypothetical protein [Sphingomonas koreensis]RSU72738.1 hypothetical protein DAH54_23360 [Sphingomonas koreensis]RSV54299.1 hypothetical protein CA229_14700 [Sphingomonas koreensis]
MSVVVLMIEHLGKVFLSTHPNHAIAWSTLLSYVNGTWAERFPDRPPPENEEERVTMFFAGEGDEYVIAEADVETDTTLH